MFSWKLVYSIFNNYVKNRDVYQTLGNKAFYSLKMSSFLIYDCFKI